MGQAPCSPLLLPAARPALDTGQGVGTTREVTLSTATVKEGPGMAWPCGGTRDGPASSAGWRHPGAGGWPGCWAACPHGVAWSPPWVCRVPRRVHPSWRPRRHPGAQATLLPHHSPPGHLRRPLPAPKCRSTAASSYSPVGPAHDLCPELLKGTGSVPFLCRTLSPREQGRS